MTGAKWYLRTQDETFGPELQEKLVEWARLGRIQPGQEVSDDNVMWRRVEDVPFLDMRFSIDIGDGNPRGPFNRAAAEALLASGRLPPSSTIVEVREPFSEPDEPAVQPEQLEQPEQPELPAQPEQPESSEKPESSEQHDQSAQSEQSEHSEQSNTPQPPVQEVVREVRVEVPVEKIVEKVVEKVVVDDARVKELEGLLEEERRHASELQDRIVEGSRKLSEAAYAATERENGFRAEITAAQGRAAGLESELRNVRAEADGLRAGLSAATERGDRLQADLATAVERGDKLQADLNVATERGTRLQADLAAATERADRLHADLALATTRAERLQADLAAAEGRATALAGQVKDAAERESKDAELIAHLEDELKRLPQAAGEVADIQAAVYGIMQTESEEIGRLVEIERNEFDALKKRYSERLDRLLERRRQLLKHAGANVEEMTRKALIERPEDPRTAQLRKELDDLRRVYDRERVDAAAKIRELSEQLDRGRAERTRASEATRDIAQVQIELQETREKLHLREKELVTERQRNEEMRQQQAAKQQALLARLATLESPSIGTSTTMATNQSREAKQVKLPGWMHFR